MTSAFFFCGSMYASKSGLRASMEALTDSSLWPRSAMSRCWRQNKHNQIWTVRVNIMNRPLPS